MRTSVIFRLISKGATATESSDFEGNEVPEILSDANEMFDGARDDEEENTVKSIIDVPESASFTLLDVETVGASTMTPPLVPN